jgi:hypothetical protein
VPAIASGRCSVSRGSPSNAGDLSDDDDATRTSESAGQSIGLAYLWRDSERPGRRCGAAQTAELATGQAFTD